MDSLKTQIEVGSSRAAQLSRQARTAFEVKDWTRGKALIREAVAASKNSQNLIAQLKEATTITPSSIK